MATRAYLQVISEGDFPNVTDFHPIPNILTGEPTTKYIVPANQIWSVAFIMASQDTREWRRAKGPMLSGPAMSVIGAYINGVRGLVVPFKNDMHYILYSPLPFNGGTEIELRLMPAYKKTRACILMGGDLIDVP